MAAPDREFLLQTLGIQTHRDAFEFLEVAKEILDQVPPFIHFLIDFEGLGTARMLRDDNLGATFVENRDDRVAEAQRQRFRSAVLATRQSGPDCRVHRSERGFWSSYRPWTCRSPDFASPFCALSVTVNLDDRGIDHGIFHVRLIRSGVEKTHENTGFAPIAVTHEHTVPLAELLRKVAPGAAFSRDPQHSFNEQPVVATATTRIPWFAQTIRFHLRPLRVRQNESIHQKLESHQASKRNPDSQQTLARHCEPTGRANARPMTGSAKQ